MTREVWRVGFRCAGGRYEGSATRTEGEGRTDGGGVVEGFGAGTGSGSGLGAGGAGGVGAGGAGEGGGGGAGAGLCTGGGGGGVGFGGGGEGSGVGVGVGVGVGDGGGVCGGGGECVWVCVGVGCGVGKQSWSPLTTTYRPPSPSSTYAYAQLSAIAGVGAVSSQVSARAAANRQMSDPYTTGSMFRAARRHAVAPPDSPDGGDWMRRRFGTVGNGVDAPRRAAS